MSSRWKRLSCVVLAAVAASSFVNVADASAQEDESELRVTSVERDDTSGQVRIDITAPNDLLGESILTESVLVVIGNDNQAVDINPVPSSEIEVVLAFDTSGSMNGDAIDSARKAGLSFLDLLPDSVKIAVVAFSDTASVRATFGTSRDAARTSIESLEAAGETALFDALVVAADQFENSTSKRRFLVVLTDGLDTASTATLDQARIEVLAKHLEPYALALATDELTTLPLEQLVWRTAGRVIRVDGPEALDQLYDELAVDLASRFTLTFTPNTASAGEARIVISQAGTIASTSVPFASYEPPPLADGTTPIETAPADEPSRPPEASEVWVTSRFASASVRNIAIAMLGVFIFLTAMLIGSPTENARRKVERTRLAIEETSLRELTNRVKGSVDRALEAQGKKRRLTAALEAAGMALRPAEFVVVVATIGMVLTAVVGLALGPLAGVVVGVLVYPVARKYLATRSRKRRALFVSQLPSTVQLLAGALRAGHTLPQATLRVSAEMEAPTCDEFHRVVTEHRLGRDFGEALHALDDRMQAQDLSWMVQAVDIHRQVGGDLAEVLDNVFETIRDRNFIRRQFAAVSAEARYSAYLITALPVIVIGVLFLTNREYISRLFTDPKGWIAIAIAGTMIGMGSITMQFLMKVKF